jgi:hypothetical protein
VFALSFALKEELVYIVSGWIGRVEWTKGSLPTTRLHRVDEMKL